MKTQYRLLINGVQSAVMDHYPADQWQQAAAMVEARGGKCTLERRLITDDSILPLLANPVGYICVGNMVICPWEIIAEVEA